MSVILVTGGTGFLGSHLVRKLAARDPSGARQIRVLVRPSSPRDVLDSLPVEFVEGDLRDPESLERAVRGASLVYHVAADYRLWLKDPRDLYESNVRGTANLLAACKATGVSRVVHTSSVAAIGIPSDGSPGDEETPVTLADMVGHYKRSKFLAEQEALRFAREGLPVVIVNPSTPVGSADRKPTSTGRMVLDFLNGRMPAYVETGLNLIDAEDVAEGHILAAEKGRSGERYILGNRNMTLKEILDTLSALTGLPSPTVKIPHWVAHGWGIVDNVTAWCAGREPRIPLEGVKMARKKMFFSAAKAVRDLGLPQRPVEEALAKAVRWFHDHGYVKRQLPRVPEIPRRIAEGREAHSGVMP